MKAPFAAGISQDPWAPRFLGAVKLAQPTTSVPAIPFGANALNLGPSSWGFGAPNAIPIPIQWPKTVNPGRPNW